MVVVKTPEHSRHHHSATVTIQGCHRETARQKALTDVKHAQEFGRNPQQLRDSSEKVSFI